MSLDTLIATAEGPDVTPGTVPAWALVFFVEETGEQLATMGSETYNGSVSATLPADLTGGAYEVVFEGMTDADYGKIHVDEQKFHLAASLYLWWKDSPTGLAGDLARFTGLDHPLGAITPDPPPLSLVAVLRVDRLRRRPGPRRFEVVVSGRELVTAQLSGKDVEPVPKLGLRDAVRAIAGQAGVRLVQDYGLADFQPPPGVLAPVKIAVQTGTCLQALTGVLGEARKLLRLYGQPLALIRNGVLHAGVWVSAVGPQLPTERHLDDDSGLLAIERGSSREREPAAGTRKDAPRSRLTVSVTTLGRPDLKPGDTLVVELPPEDFPAVEPQSIGATVLGSLNVRPFGDLAPDPTPVRCRITDVTHRISREEGFVTVAKAFVLAGGDDGWDVGGSTRAPEVRATPPIGEPPADPAQAFAVSLRSATATLTAGVAQQARSHVGLVHDHVAAEATETRHTSDFWVSRDPGDGSGSAAQRAEVSRDVPAEAHRVPYATPFAWGNFGLVLPRYPGTRVLLVDGAGGPGEYVDAGALWMLNAGPKAEAGDYWLALPTGVVAPEHLPREGGQPSEVDQLPPDGPATHDLIDSDGTRLIETARFVLRVVDDPVHLTNVPNRPDPDSGGPVGSVLIETKPDGGTPARILLRADGSVTITGSSITFDAGDGQIDFKAKDVRVALAGGTMDVS